MRTALLLTCLFLSLPAFAADCPATLDYRFRTLGEERQETLCEAHRGEVLLVVNTASKCGFTPQFDGLEALQKRFGSRGFAVLGFPSNDFAQDPAGEREIRDFCQLTYGVEFAMYEKTHVADGAAQHPFFRTLAAATGQSPGWNFHKYLIDRQGHVVAAFPSRVGPDDPRLIGAIEKLL